MTEADLRALALRDKTLAQIIKKIGPVTYEANAKQSPFHSLLRSIVYQQLNGRAAATIYGRMLALYPGGRAPKAQLVVKTAIADLRKAGLSNAKALAVKDLAQKTLDGVVPTAAQIKKMDNEQIIERLVQIRGVGRWTVEMLLIFNLGREDVLPLNDFAVRKAFSLAYGHTDTAPLKDLEEWGMKKWSPHRSAAAWYMWRYLDLLRSEESEAAAKKVTPKNSRRKSKL